MSHRKYKKEDSSSEESDFSDEEASSEQSYDDEENSDEESSVDKEEHEEETGLAEILSESLDYLKDEYDKLVQQKLQELENQKNVEISFFREQKQLFKEELLALRKEKQDSAQIIRELQAQLAAQRVQFDRTLADFKESIQSN